MHRYRTPYDDSRHTHSQLAAFSGPSHTRAVGVCALGLRVSQGGGQSLISHVCPDFRTEPMPLTASPPGRLLISLPFQLAVSERPKHCSTSQCTSRLMLHLIEEAEGDGSQYASGRSRLFDNAAPLD